MDSEGYAAMRQWIIAGKELLFPPSCLGCLRLMDGRGKALCQECLEGVALIDFPKCPACGKQFDDSALGDHLCGPCLRKKPLFSSAFAVAHYQEPVSTFLHKLKYDGDLSVLPALQAIIELGLPVTLTREDRVIPVPLYSQRLRHRGFNQAVLIARLFFPDSKDLILVDSLLRIRHTEPQTGLDGTARRKNLHNAFMVSKREAIRGRRVVLVDDVFTTGTTAEACSRALLDGGARDVQVLTVARVRS